MPRCRPRRPLPLARTATLVAGLATGLAAAIAVPGGAWSWGAARRGGAAGTVATVRAPAPSHTPVEVLYAGSLVDVMEHALGPRFDKATGDTFDGFAAGSQALASEIKSGARQGDVLVSASAAVDDSLRGPSNGNWVTWYATFATSPLVLGYDPHSRFAARLRSEPWYRVVGEPGFLLGRTDPAIDPKGVLTVTALRQTAERRHDPALARLATGTAGVFPEETLVGRLQAGQLDAGFFYAGEAAAAGIPTVPLSGVHLSARFTVTILQRAPHPDAARAFVAYLTGSHARSILRRYGFPPVHPVQVSQPRGVPADLRRALGLPTAR